jgi:hypothetical protein
VRNKSNDGYKADNTRFGHRQHGIKVRYYYHYHMSIVCWVLLDDWIGHWPAIFCICYLSKRLPMKAIFSVHWCLAGFHMSTKFTEAVVRQAVG